MRAKVNAKLPGPKNKEAHDEVLARALKVLDSTMILDYKNVGKLIPAMPQTRPLFNKVAMEIIDASDGSDGG